MLIPPPPPPTWEFLGEDFGLSRRPEPYGDTSGITISARNSSTGDVVQVPVRFVGWSESTGDGYIYLSNTYMTIANLVPPGYAPGTYDAVISYRKRVT